MRCVCASEAATGATQGVFAAACPACTECVASGIARDAGAVARRVPLRAWRCGHSQSILLRKTTEDQGRDGCGAGGVNRDTAAAKCGWQDAARAADGHEDGVPEWRRGGLLQEEWRVAWEDGMVLIAAQRARRALLENDHGPDAGGAEGVRTTGEATGGTPCGIASAS